MSEFALIDEDTRRKVFWLLQRATSVALWSKMADAWQDFTDAFESAVKTWPGRYPERLNASVLPDAFQALSLYQRGLDELKKGRRDVWKIGGSLYRAKHEANLVKSYLYVDTPDFERGSFLGTYPLIVDAIFQILIGSVDRMEGAAMEADYALEQPAQFPGAEAILSPENYQFALYKLPYPVFPAVLPPLPNPTDIIVASGETAPKDGIWEPVEAEKQKRLGLIPSGFRVVQSLGCYNYIVAGAKAPKFLGEYDPVEDDFPAINIHWRLIWEDTRYRDGTIPDESAYLVTTDPTTVVRARETPINSDEVISGTGDLCPVSGDWAPMDFAGNAIHIGAGTRMPEWLIDAGAGEKKAHWVRWRLVLDRA